MSTAQTQKAWERVADSLFFQVVVEKIPEARRGLGMGQYLLSKGQLDSAELCFDLIIRDRQKRDKETVVRCLIGKCEVLKRRKAFGLARRTMAVANELAAGEPSPLRGAVRMQEASVSLAAGDLHTALTQLQEARELLAESPEPTMERAQVALLMGLVHQQLVVQPEEALPCYKEAAGLAAGVGNAQLEVLALFGAAQVLSELGRLKAALGECERADVALSKAGQDPNPLQVLVAEVKAGVYQAMGDLKRAKEACQEALDRASDPKDQARLYSALALLHHALGRPQQARDFERRSQETLEKLGTESPEVLLNLSRLNLSRGQVRTADEQFFTATLAMPEDGDPRARLDLQLREIEISVLQGKGRAARELATQLREQLSPDQTPLILAGVLVQLGGLAMIRGAPDEAEPCYREALAIADGCGARLTAVAALRGLAMVAMGRHEPSGAIHRLEEATDIARECGAVLVERGMSLDLAFARAQAAKTLRQAIPSFEEGISDGRLLDAITVEIAALASLGLLHWTEGTPDLAAEYLEEAVEKATAAGLEHQRIVAQGLLGCVLVDLGERERARESLEQALDAIEEVGLETELEGQLQERYRDLTGFAYQP